MLTRTWRCTPGAWEEALRILDGFAVIERHGTAGTLRPRPTRAPVSGHFGYDGERLTVTLRRPDPSLWEALEAACGPPMAIG